MPFARGCRVGVWFGFVGAALLLAVGTCVVLAFVAMPGRCCFLRVTPTLNAVEGVTLDNSVLSGKGVDHHGVRGVI